MLFIINELDFMHYKGFGPFKRESLREKEMLNSGMKRVLPRQRTRKESRLSSKVEGKRLGSRQKKSQSEDWRYKYW